MNSKKQLKTKFKSCDKIIVFQNEKFIPQIEEESINFETSSGLKKTIKVPKKTLLLKI